MMEKIIALGIHLQLSCSEIEDIAENGYNDCSFTYGKQEYLVLTDEEADEYWDDYLENYIDECVLPELNERYHIYFNRESWKDDAKIDGRGHCINHYDGQEHSVKFKDETYYVYRTN